jgi:hypothetical protein
MLLDELIPLLDLPLFIPIILFELPAPNKPPIFSLKSLVLEVKKLKKCFKS